MSELDKIAERIREAYARTVLDLRAQKRTLPRWENLQSEMHEAFITVYFQGRRDAFAEIQAKGDTPDNQ